MTIGTPPPSPERSPEAMPGAPQFGPSPESLRSAELAPWSPFDIVGSHMVELAGRALNYTSGGRLRVHSLTNPHTAVRAFTHLSDKPNLSAHYTAQARDMALAEALEIASRASGPDEYANPEDRQRFNEVCMQLFMLSLHPENQEATDFSEALISELARNNMFLPHTLALANIGPGRDPSRPAVAGIDLIMPPHPFTRATALPEAEMTVNTVLINLGRVQPSEHFLNMLASSAQPIERTPDPLTPAQILSRQAHDLAQTVEEIRRSRPGGLNDVAQINRLITGQAVQNAANRLATFDELVLRDTLIDLVPRDWLVRYVIRMTHTANAADEATLRSTLTSNTKNDLVHRLRLRDHTLPQLFAMLDQPATPEAPVHTPGIRGWLGHLVTRDVRPPYTLRRDAVRQRQADAHQRQIEGSGLSALCTELARTSHRAAFGNAGLSSRDMIIRATGMENVLRLAVTRRLNGPAATIEFKRVGR